jgi:methionine-rich copper-binding protein CopC
MTLYRTLCFAALLAAAPVSAHAHAELREASPAVGATITGAPAEIRLRFTKEIGDTSTVTVTGPMGRVENGKPVFELPYVMRIGLKQMTAGTYRVEWHVTSADGHKTQGTYNFTVK